MLLVGMLFVLELLFLLAQFGLQVLDLPLLSLYLLLLSLKLVFFLFTFLTIVGQVLYLGRYLGDHAILFLFGGRSHLLELFGLLDDFVLLLHELFVDFTFLALLLEESHGLQRTLTLDDEGSGLVKVVLGDFVLLFGLLK